MCTAVSTIANGGTHVQPRVVKQIIDSQTGEVTNVEPVKSENVISEENAKKVLSMMESVVAEGTRKKCAGCRLQYWRKNWNIRRWSKYK